MAWLSHPFLEVVYGDLSVKSDWSKLLNDVYYVVNATAEINHGV